MSAPDQFAAFRDAPPASAGDSTLAAPAQWFVNWARAGSDSVHVNEFTAVSLSAIYSCVKLISGSIAALPMKVYRRRDDGGQDEAPGEPEYPILKDEFNGNTSAMTGRQAGVAHLLTWGNSYAQVVRSRGRVVALQPLGPDCVHPRLLNGRLVYDVHQRGGGGEIVTLRREDVLHVPGIGFDSLVGYSTARVNRGLFTTAAAQDKVARDFAVRGIRPPGGIRFPPGKKFKSPAEAAEFRRNFLQIHAYEDEKDLHTVILEDGAEWFQLGVNPETFQLLESRQFSRGEVAGVFLVPPHMMGDSDKASSWGTGIGEMTAGFLTYCLLPHIRSIEAEYNRKLFGDRPGLFCEHVLAGLLRADTFKRTQSLEILHRRGIVTDNEWRKLEGLNPVPGGDVRHFPLNEARVDADGETLAAAPGAAPSPHAPPTPIK